MLHDLMLNGFVIYPKEDKFFLEKIAVPTFPAIITAQAFDTYEQALNYAADVLQEHKEKTLREYSTIVRYNRGLGIEYKNLPVIYATNMEVLHTPGHSPGSVCFVLRGSDKHIVFSGDTLFSGSIGRTDLWGGDYETIIKSIQTRLFTLEDETLVIPGHGEASVIYREKMYNPYLN
jgi:glyoxylase-like metal-dependent hydrolase (beta-lactamase superfamily II)